MKEYKIIDNIRISESTYVLSVKRDFEFVPGQIVSVTTNEKIAPRLYSICSGNKETDLKLLYSIKSEGQLTPQLSLLKSGNIVHISIPGGQFKPAINNACWISAGTGIAPFVSTIQSLECNNITLIHGARIIDDFYFSNIFEKFAGVDYIRCCSSSNNNVFYEGRLTQYLTEKDNLPVNQLYYLCGSAEMIVETRDILISKGISFSNIFSEIYF